jgi:excisionase family DNA binding protein
VTHDPARPDVERIGNDVVLRGQAVLDGAGLVGVAIRQGLARDGIAAPQRHRDIEALLKVTAADIRAGKSARTCASASEIDTSPTGRASSFSEWLRTGEAADLLGVSESAVRLAVAEGRLAAQLIGRRCYLIHRDDINEFATKRRKTA